jgi:pyrroloquinoline quinone biosynthesis protein B
MIIKVLGSAAGGGFPQINCNCRNCSGVRAGDAAFSARTQTSLAVSVDHRSWVLFNASPDLRQQISNTPELAPSRDHGARGSPIASVVVTGGEVDHVAGLLNLREGVRFTLFASAPILAILAGNGMFDVLNGTHVQRTALPLGVPTPVAAGLSVEAFAVPGKAPLYLAEGGANRPEAGAASLGLKISEVATGAGFYFIPGCAFIDATLTARLRGADLVLFDGTLFTDEEMVAQGLSQKTGRSMGHVSIDGPHGSMAACARLGIGRRVYVHINNSNPVLAAGSAQRAMVERAGWEIGFDGMEFRL